MKLAGWGGVAVCHASKPPGERVYMEKLVNGKENLGTKAPQLKRHTTYD